MLTYPHAILLGLLQGITELFPISSLGHSVLLPAVFGWQLDQHAPSFLVFLVATHLATALVLLLIFLKDWVRIAQGFLRSIIYRRIDPKDTYAKLAWLLLLATIPAGVLGLLFQNKLAALFASPHIVAVFLMGNGILLALAERLRTRRKRLDATPRNVDASISRIGVVRALLTGTLQALALLPGFSRTGASLAGGLISGLDHESAVRFSFLLATPIIFAAALLKLPALFTPGYPVGPTLAGAGASAVAAFFAAIFLTRYFRTNTLRPFAAYCFAAGAIAIAVFLMQ